MKMIEEIESKIKYWKANSKLADQRGNYQDSILSEGKAAGLELAVRIAKRPSNTAIHVDTKPCGSCRTYRLHFNSYAFCPKCSRALSK